MEKLRLNSDGEWNFITKEIHREKLNDKNRLKRELLFVLQILLSKEDYTLYLKSKEKYMNFL